MRLLHIGRDAQYRLAGSGVRGNRHGLHLAAFLHPGSVDHLDLPFLAGRDGVRGFIPKSELSGSALEALLG